MTLLNVSTAVAHLRKERVSIQTEPLFARITWECISFLRRIKVCLSHVNRLNEGLQISGESASTTALEVFSDSDWAADKTSRKSVSANAIF